MHLIFLVQFQNYKYFGALHHLSGARVDEMNRSESSIAAVIFVEVRLRISREKVRSTGILNNTSFQFTQLRNFSYTHSFLNL